jgi:aryl-alcohol dehydrogenase-like predicted oxidoreductase
MERGFEKDLAPLCRREGVSVIPYYGLASGFLTGKYRNGASSDSPRAEKAQSYLDERGERVLQALDEVADANGVPVASVAIMWLLAKPHVEAPIASARTPEQLSDILPSVQLDPEQVAKLDEASA